MEPVETLETRWTQIARAIYLIFGNFCKVQKRSSNHQEQFLIRTKPNKLHINYLGEIFLIFPISALIFCPTTEFGKALCKPFVKVHPGYAQFLTNRRIYIVYT